MCPFPPPHTHQLFENLGPDNDRADCTAISQIITLHTYSTHVLSGDLPGVCVTVTGDDQLLHELLIGDQVPLKPTDMGAISRNEGIARQRVFVPNFHLFFNPI